MLTSTQFRVLSGVCLLVAVSGCSSSSKASTPTSVRTAPTSTTVVKAVACGGTSTVPDAVVASRAAGLNGTGPIEYTVRQVRVSTSDPTWARFAQVAKPAYRDNFQPAYGLVQCQAGHWTVIDFGTAKVGCPGKGRLPGPVPPAKVRNELQLGC